MAEEHEHYFKPIIGHHPPGAIPAWELISGYEPCSCGMTWSQYACDPMANAQAAMKAWNHFGNDYTGTGETERDSKPSES